MKMLRLKCDFRIGGSSCTPSISAIAHGRGKKMDCGLPRSSIYTPRQPTLLPYLPLCRHGAQRGKPYREKLQHAFPQPLLTFTLPHLPVLLPLLPQRRIRLTWSVFPQLHPSFLPTSSTSRPLRLLTLASSPHCLVRCLGAVLAGVEQRNV